MKPPQLYAKDDRGVTLLEILVVMSILAVLLMAGYPVVVRTMEIRHNLSCQNNLRTAGKALQMYIADMDQQLAMRRGGSRGGAGIDLWAAEISGRGYLEEPARPDGYRSYSGEDPKILRCPIGDLPADYSMTNWAWYTYGVNLFSPGSKSETREGTPLSIRHIAGVDNPSQFVLLADSAKSGSLVQYFRMSEGQAGLSLRHAEKGNILFLDNHIESVTRMTGETLGFPAIYTLTP